MEVQFNEIWLYIYMHKNMEIYDFLTFFLKQAAQI